MHTFKFNDVVEFFSHAKVYDQLLSCIAKHELKLLFMIKHELLLCEENYHARTLIQIINPFNYDHEHGNADKNKEIQ